MQSQLSLLSQQGPYKAALGSLYGQQPLGSPMPAQAPQLAPEQFGMMVQGLSRDRAMKFQKKMLQQQQV